MKNELNRKKFLNAIAFIALIFAGIALLIAKFFIPNTVVGRVLSNLSYILAFVTTAVCAFNYVRTKRNIVYTIIYIIAVTLVVVPLVLSLFNM
ncbi:MAG: hypothetical protein IKR12_00220 [Clostridia bacterium]|nr:hypothetical protein [Clostridia bacterium]